MSQIPNTELRKFLDKKVSVDCDHKRYLVGVLRGFDPFMNLVLDDSRHIKKDGTVKCLGMVMIRGSCVQMVEEQCESK